MTRPQLTLLAAILVGIGFLLNGVMDSRDRDHDRRQSSNGAANQNRRAKTSHAPKSPARANQTVRSRQPSTPPPSISGLEASVKVVPQDSAGSLMTLVSGPNLQGSVQPMQPSASAPMERSSTPDSGLPRQAEQLGGLSPTALAARLKAFDAGRQDAMKARVEELAAHQPGCKCAAHLGEN